MRGLVEIGLRGWVRDGGIGQNGSEGCFEGVRHEEYGGGRLESGKGLESRRICEGGYGCGEAGAGVEDKLRDKLRAERS